jgi:DNA-binding beta-propeller fold protein YncE
MKEVGLSSSQATSCRRVAASLSRSCLAVAVLLLVGCASADPLLKRTQSSGPQWPKILPAAKIEWVKSISTAEDTGITKGFWRRALELLTGADKHPITRPYGVLFDDNSRLVVADPGSGVVHLFETKEGRYTSIKGDGESRLQVPIGLAEDEKGRLYISDSSTGKIFRYDFASRVLTTFKQQLQRPTGIAYNSVNKLLYISETTAHRVVAVDETGIERVRFGEDAIGLIRFNHPTDIVVDAKGQVFVTDPLNYKIRTFTPEGILVNEFGSMGDSPGEFNKPKGVAVDSRGHIYVTDALLDAVQVFDDNGRFLFSIGTTGAGIGELWMPSGIFIHNDYIFVADTYNQRVQIFRYVIDREPGDD